MDDPYVTLYIKVGFEWAFLGLFLPPDVPISPSNLSKMSIKFPSDTSSCHEILRWLVIHRLKGIERAQTIQVPSYRHDVVSIYSVALVRDIVIFTPKSTSSDSEIFFERNLFIEFEVWAIVR